MNEPTIELESPDGVTADLPALLADLMQKQRGWKTCSGSRRRGGGAGRGSRSGNEPAAPTPAAEVERVAPKQKYAAGVDPDKAVPQTYIPGMVLGVTAAKIAKLVQSGAVPHTLQGRTKLVKPSDVAAALDAES